MSCQVFASLYCLLHQYAVFVTRTTGGNGENDCGSSCSGYVKCLLGFCFLIARDSIFLCAPTDFRLLLSDRAKGKPRSLLTFLCSLIYDLLHSCVSSYQEGSVLISGRTTVAIFEMDVDRYSACFYKQNYSK